MLKSEKYGHAVDWYALGAVLCASLLSKVSFLQQLELNYATDCFNSRVFL